MAAVKPCDRTDAHDAHGWGDPPYLVCWGIDFDWGAPVGPDCRDGKHPACGCSHAASTARQWSRYSPSVQCRSSPSPSQRRSQHEFLSAGAGFLRSPRF